MEITEENNMFKFTYESQGASTFLVYEKQPHDQIDTMSMGMLSNNKIDGVIPFTYVRMDDATYFKY